MSPFYYNLNTHSFTSFPFCNNNTEQQPPQSMKRSRSTESIEKALKRSKPFKEESPLSVTSNNSASTPPSTTTTLDPLYPLHANNNNNHIPSTTAVRLKPIRISTKSSTDTSAYATSNYHYQDINNVLHSVHVERHGDPESRESWWKEAEDIEMDCSEEETIAVNNEEYNSANYLLKQVFLQRHQQ